MDILTHFFTKDQVGKEGEVSGCIIENETENVSLQIDPKNINRNLNRAFEMGEIAHNLFK